MNTLTRQQNMETLELQRQTELVKEIHAQFDTAEDRLLAEAQSIINTGDKVNRQKALRLAAIGFSRAKPVRDAEGLTVKVGEAQQIRDDIQWCRDNYPLYRYISELELQNVCKKYGLQYSNSFKYLGDIPEKNLCEIEAFKPKKEQANYPSADRTVQWLSGNRRSRQNGHDRSMELYRQHLQEHVQYTRSLQPVYASVTPTGWAVDMNALSQEYANSGAMYFYSQAQASTFMIAAPPQDFEVNTMIGDHMQGAKLVHDPIVLYPVRRGFLIISKWGLEASDEAVINEQHN